MSSLFEDTRDHAFEAAGATTFARVGGNGPPLLLLHGFPQTHAMWHAVYPELSRRYTCVMPDLRGYGRSSCPANDAGNMAYSKRTMAADMVGLMASLGHHRFLVVGHDRGGRVAYRMAFDHPDAVISVAVLDIVPTAAMWRQMDTALGMKTYHWFMLAQPEPLPEMLLGASPEKYLDYTIASWTKAKNLSAFDPRAMAVYRESFARPDYFHAACNDYRAGATIDREIDEADLAAGRRIAAPLLALWGDAGIPSATSGPLDTWRQWADNVEGQGIDAGHFIAEENPAATLAALMPFLEKHTA